MIDSLAFSSRHFELTQLTTGVVAAIARRESGGEMANAAFVDLGREVLVFDTFLLPQAARDLRRAAQLLVGKPIRYVVNSHFHAGHVFGNSVFPSEATFVATAGTRALMASRGQAYLELLKVELPARLQRLRRLHDQMMDPAAAAALAARLTFTSSLLQDLAGISLRLPTLTTNTHALIHGSHRNARFLSFGGGHTDSDGFLYLPDDGVLFAGDLVVNNTHPAMRDAHPDQWLLVLEELLKLDFAVVVPGHGPVATRDDVEGLLTYFETLTDMSLQTMTEGGEEEQVATAQVPGRYRDWFGTHFPDNLRAVYRNLVSPSDEEA